MLTLLCSVGLPFFLPFDEDLSSAKELSQSCQPMNFRCTEFFMAGVVSPTKDMLWNQHWENTDLNYSR